MAKHEPTAPPPGPPRFVRQTTIGSFPQPNITLHNTSYTHTLHTHAHPGFKKQTNCGCCHACCDNLHSLYVLPRRLNFSHQVFCLPLSSQNTGPTVLRGQW